MNSNFKTTYKRPIRNWLFVYVLLATIILPSLAWGQDSSVSDGGLHDAAVPSDSSFAPTDSAGLVDSSAQHDSSLFDAAIPSIDTSAAPPSPPKDLSTSPPESTRPTQSQEQFTTPLSFPGTQPPQPASQPYPANHFPTVESQPTSTSQGDFYSEVQGFLNFIQRDHSIPEILLLFAVLAIALLMTFSLRGMRAKLPTSGIIPSFLAVLHLALRILIVGLAITLLVEVLPSRLSLITLLIAGGIAIAIGWSTRDILPDLIAGFILVFERRIRRGVWVSGNAFHGQVEQLRLRDTTIRDVQGREISVPNRLILKTPITTGTKERDYEVSLIVDSHHNAEKIRHALRDAVLSSPWVFPGALPTVLQDPENPSRWRVRGRLLETGFGARFEGELLERTQAILFAQIADENDNNTDT